MWGVNSTRRSDRRPRRFVHKPAFEYLVYRSVPLVFIVLYGSANSRRTSLPPESAQGTGPIYEDKLPVSRRSHPVVDHSLPKGTINFEVVVIRYDF
jgi:hypothetical protein